MGNVKKTDRLPKKIHGGFTLLELLVVIVIISVMAAMLVPTLDNSKRRLVDSAGELVLLINMAQQEVILSSRVWQLVLETEKNQYRFQQLGGMEFEDVSMRPLAGGHQIQQLSLDELEVNGQPVSADVAEVYFYPTGEQDTFRLILGTGSSQYMVAMGAVGPAWMEEL